MSSQKIKPKVPNPYELAKGDAQKLGYVDFDLKTLELDEDFDEDFTIEGDLSNITRNVDIVNDLLETDDPIDQFLSKFDAEFLSKHFSSKTLSPKIAQFCLKVEFKNELVKYFLYLFTRLQQLGVNYLNLHDENPEYDSKFYCDYASVGTRFWKVLTESKLFSRAILRKLSKLIYRYLQLYPQEMLHIRDEIVKARVHLSIDPLVEPAQLKSLINEALKPIDNCKLFSELSRNELSHEERIELFTKTVAVPSAPTDLTELLCKVIGKSIFPELKLEFVQIGCSTNIDYRVLQFQLSFGVADSKILDRSTISLVMTSIVQVMKKVGFNGKVINSVVEFEIDNEKKVSSSPNRKLLVFSISSESFCKLVDFYLRYDSRFGQMILLLKYYITESKLSNNSAFINEPFIWLIIWFLQQTEPTTVLPTLNALNLTKRKSDLIHFSTDLNSVPASLNHQSVGELVVQFIDWFCQFDFGTFLNPCDGTSYAKDSHFERFGFDYHLIQDEQSYLCILDPFSHSFKTIFSKEDVKRWKKVFSKLMDHFEINSDDYLLVLTNPDCFMDPDSKIDFNPTYLNRVPRNPYKLSLDEAEELQYPKDVSDLKLLPKSNPFANLPTSSSQLVEFQFAQDFIFTSEPINKILESYNRDHLQLHYANIVNYFCHLQSRLLMKTNLNYNQLIDVVRYDDYAAYGERFWIWLNECILFPLDHLRNYSILIYRYLEKFPKNILNLRSQLCDIYVKIESCSPVEPTKPQIVDSKFVTYIPVNRKNLHDEIKAKTEVQDQINHLLDQVYHKDQLKQFCDFINGIITSDKYLVPLRISLENAFYLSGFNLCPNEFYFVVKFGNIQQELDLHTFVMVTQVVKKSLDVRFEFEFSKLNKHSFSFKLRPSKPSTNLKTKLARSKTFQVNLISTSLKLYSRVSLSMLSHYDQRFDELVLILSYWADIHDFVKESPFNIFLTFVWFILHFVQQTNPPVLPPLKQIQNKNVKSTKPNTNHQSTVDSTPELIVQFLKFCTTFDFANRVICPHDGTSYTKEEYSNILMRKFDKRTESFSLVQDPLLKNFFSLAEKSTENFVKFVTKLLDEEKIDSQNCIVKLTDPCIKHF